MWTEKASLTLFGTPSPENPSQCVGGSIEQRERVDVVINKNHDRASSLRTAFQKIVFRRMVKVVVRRIFGPQWTDR